MTFSSNHESWLRQAERDLEAADILSKSGFHEWTCYCCQQAVEKGVKAIHAALGLTPPKVHALTTLFGAWEDLVAREDEELADAQTKLSQYAISTRYPDVGGVGPPCDRYDERKSAEALEYARKLLDLCKTLAVKAAKFSHSIRDEA